MGYMETYKSWCDNEYFDEATRDELKSRGFKWSPKNSAWQRKLTPNAIYITKRMFKDIGSLEIKLVNDYTKTI